MAEQGLHLGQTTLSVEHTGPTVGPLKPLGRLGRVREQICSVSSCVGSVWNRARVSVPIQHAKSESIGSLRIGAIECSDWLCASESVWCVGGVEVTMVNKLLSVVSVDDAWLCNLWFMAVVFTVCICNSSAERVRREAAEWLDEGSWQLAVESGLYVGPFRSAHLRVAVACGALPASTSPCKCSPTLSLLFGGSLSFHQTILLRDP